MTKLLMNVCAASCSPFEAGGNFGRVSMDPKALLAELRAELEDVRTRRRQIQEMLNLNSRQILECGSESEAEREKGVIKWLTGAAVTFIFGLLFSAGAVASCGACGTFGISGLLILIGVILAFRALSEYGDLKKMGRNRITRLERYNREHDKYNEQLYKLNLREAELEESIRSAQKYM